MPLKDNNIEELFRTGLEDFETPVNDAMWNNISKGIANTATTTSTVVSGSSKLLTYLGLSGAACAIGVAATLYFTDTEKINISTTQQNKTTEEIISNDQQINTEQTEKLIENTSSDDADIVEQITQPELITTDPIISEIKQEPKKVVVVTEDEKQYYKGSWINGFLTKKDQPYTEPTDTPVITDASDLTTTDIATSSEDPISPIIEEVQEHKIIASIVAMPVGGYAPLEVSFAQHSDKGTVSWDFGDGYTSTEQSPTHIFEKYGEHTVTLTIVDEEGEKHQDFRVIEVMPNSALTNIPNIFTPNNDGSNDFFVVEGKNIESFTMAILNKQNTILYKSDNIENKWDGKNQYGEPVPNGTYVIVISARGIDGKKYEHNGTVTILK